MRTLKAVEEDGPAFRWPSTVERDIARHDARCADVGTNGGVAAHTLKGETRVRGQQRGSRGERVRYRER